MKAIIDKIKAPLNRFHVRATSPPLAKMAARVSHTIQDKPIVQFRCRLNQLLSLIGASGWWTYLCFSSKSKPVSLCPHRGQNFIPSTPAFPQLGQYFINNSTVHFVTLTGYFNIRRLLTMASKSSSHSLYSSGNAVQVTVQTVLFTIQTMNT